MYSLLSGLWRWFFSSHEMKFLILGIDNAGKTTTMEMVKTLHGAKGLAAESIPPTVGLNIGKIKVDDVEVVFWDLGGQLALRSIWEKYYDECEGLLFVVDSTDVDRLPEARECLHAVLQSYHLRGRSLPVVVLANKQDLSRLAMKAEDLSRILELDKLLERCSTTREGSGGVGSSSGRVWGGSVDSYERSAGGVGGIAVSSATAATPSGMVNTIPLRVVSCGGDETPSSHEPNREVHIMPVSALEGTNIFAAVKLLTSAADRNRRKHEEQESRKLSKARSEA